ncbi:MAG TPA: hypothetical protein VMV05_09600 [bacterium]|nr:hypothetical protein [bacterium]
MKRLFWLSPVAILATLWMIGLGCTTNNNPVAPPTWTPVPNTATSTKTNTPTKTATATVAVTNTATNTPADTASNTPTATPTDTSVFTATDTATDTPSGTPTDTATDTVTDTPTNTPTATATAYTWTTVDFEGSSSVPSGWFSSGESGFAAFSALAISTVQNHTISGTNALQASITFSGANQAADFGFQFNTNPGGVSNTNLTGLTISLWFYIDQAPGLTAGSANTGIYQFWIQDGAPSYNWQSNNFSWASPPVGTWTQISIPANQGGIDPSDVWKFGLQLGTGSQAATGQTVNLYIDDISIQ